MPKNIVLLADGTGNSAASPFKTNVWRLYKALDPAGDTQIALYDDGVGTETFKPLAALGGAFGLGVWKNVQSLYTYLCRNYQPGDSVYLFGFSRGAFTAFPFSLYAIFRLWQFLHGTDVETFRFGSPTPAPAPVSDGGERVLARA